MSSRPDTSTRSTRALARVTVLGAAALSLALFGGAPAADATPLPSSLAASTQTGLTPTTLTNPVSSLATALGLTSSVPPALDPFYAAPADLASYRPGQVVATRQVTPKLLLLPVAVRAMQISFRSNDQHDKPILGVTTLLVPFTPYWFGPRPVVSYQAAQDSTGSACAPSYGLTQGSVMSAGDVAQFGEFLLKNWAVVLPDHLGPDNSFLVGKVSGQVSLDSLRAVKSLGIWGVGAQNQYGLAGYSGGGQATSWTAQLQRTYAPDVALVGAAVGGVPSDLLPSATRIDGGPWSGFLFGALGSYVRAYPESGLGGMLNARGVQDVATAKEQCLPALLATFAFHSLNDDVNVPNIYADARFTGVLAAQRAGGVAPTMPIYDYHVITDEVVHVSSDDQMVRDWQARGAQVQVVRDPVGGHVTEMTARIPSVVMFLADRFAGRPFTPSSPLQ